MSAATSASPTISSSTTPPGAQMPPATSCSPMRVLMLQPYSVKTFCTSTAFVHAVGDVHAEDPVFVRHGQLLCPSSCGCTVQQ